MTKTVDVVVIGANQSALNAAVDLAHSGKRVLVISLRRSPDLRRRLRRVRAAAGAVVSKRIAVLTGVEVECIAGIRSVEAVLARYVVGGRRVDVNATSLLTFEDEPETRIAPTRGVVRC